MSLSAGENIRVDAMLDVGQVTERVEVSAEAPQLKTESTEVSTTMEQKLVDQVPLPIAGIGGGMRNAFSIMMMLPQVKSGNGESAWDDFQVGGGQQHDWNVSVDGLSVEMGWRNHVGYMNRLTPPVDSVQEFRIETATFKAEDSRASGGNIGVTTKSGTNELHGSVFDYYQSQRLNANSWLNNKLGRQKSIFHRNDFGANVGGPVYIPKVYNGKNKTWFFFSYEGYRFPSTAGVSQLTLPTQKMVNGDFTDWRSNSGALLPIYDPQSTRSDGKGGFIRDVFPGNIIPQNRLSPSPARSPNTFRRRMQPACCATTTRWVRSRTNASRTRLLTKFDQNFGSKNRLAFTWSRNGEHFNYAYDDNPENPANWSSIPYPLGGRKYYNGDQYYGNVFRLNDTHLITPQLINILTLGAHRLTHPEHDRTAVPFGQIVGRQAERRGGQQSVLQLQLPASNFPDGQLLRLGQLQAVGRISYGLRAGREPLVGQAEPQLQVWLQLPVADAEYEQPQQRSGNFAFNRLETSAPADNSGNSGNAFASFMLGALHSGGFTVPNTGMLRFPYHAFFAQDDWKVTSRLTLNLGLRYELNVGAYEKHDRMSYFDPTLPNPAANGFPGALRFLGSRTGPGGPPQSLE